MEYTIAKYLYNFVWNDSKFPRNYALNRITDLIETKLSTFENDFRNMLNSFGETKAQISQNKTK